jgi:hypothetical protein
MELKNVNRNGGNVVVSNLNNVNFYFLESVKIELKNKINVIFLIRCHNCLKNKNHHIVHVTNQH